MTTEAHVGIEQQEKAKSQRYSRKSAGRAEWMRKLHQEGRAGQGGRKVDHGQYALDRRLQEGLDPSSAMAHHHTERVAAYAAVLGGVERLDEFQRGLLDRLADNDVSRSILVGSRTKWKTSTMTRILRDIDAFNKNGLQYLQLLKVIKETDQRKVEPQELIIRRYAAEPHSRPESLSPACGAQQTQKEQER